MLFLLGEERVLSSFAETWRKRQTLAWPQHPDFQRRAVCFVAEPLASVPRCEGEARGMLLRTLALGH